MLKDLHHFEFGAVDQLMEISAFQTYPLAFAFSTEIAQERPCPARAGQRQRH